ncbi:hypothetical protein ICN48_06460 [Polynucleobacter sp. JS-Safj-400b-B2]|uniref:hypothetical protein n=1 Tax=Polynucleobacter sp. JS-Safj-400b-B2 TaxID=2576921 RepID=UPI001C0CA095|nr:hypothetical protein [Polynucleobacter sp. JS-Safj-400b-B2]MBU3625875.1 hypothetical protein [Polynucleobacter sp. JS-Safj-400b-B2]
MYIFDNGYGTFIGLRIVSKYEVFGVCGSQINREDKPLVEFYELAARSDNNPVYISGRLISRVPLSQLDRAVALSRNGGLYVVYGEFDIAQESLEKAVEYVYEAILDPESIRSDYVSTCLARAEQLKFDPCDLILFVQKLLREKEQNQALSMDSGQDGSDYTLRPSESSAWITVDGFSVYVKREDDGVLVDIFGKAREGENPIASTRAHKIDLTVNAVEE